jgi:hypothetical protein
MTTLVALFRGIRVPQDRLDQPVSRSRRGAEDDLDQDALQLPFPDVER